MAPKSPSADDSAPSGCSSGGTSSGFSSSSGSQCSCRVVVLGVPGVGKSGTCLIDFYLMTVCKKKSILNETSLMF